MSTFAYRVSVDTVAAKQTLVVIPDNDYVQVPVLHRICSCFDPLPPPPPSSIQFQLIIFDQEPAIWYLLPDQIQHELSGACCGVTFPHQNQISSFFYDQDQCKDVSSIDILVLIEVMASTNNIMIKMLQYCSTPAELCEIWDKDISVSAADSTSWTWHFSL